MIKLSKSVLSIATIASAALFASSASAQMSYYGGAGLSYSAADSAGGPSEGNLFGVSLTSGIRFDTSSSIFYGAELDGEINVAGDLAFVPNGLTCADGFADSPFYYCSQNATVRLRGLVGTNIGGFDVFGSIGYGMVSGQRATGPGGTTASAVTGGMTYGVGAQMDFGSGLVRMEVIRDQFDQGIQGFIPPDWNATSAKVSYLWSF